MPFFQNARHFIINGPDGQGGNVGARVNTEEIERKVSSALQAVDQGIARSAIVNGQPAPTIESNSQHLSLSSGSSSFNGHMGKMSAEDKGYLDAELAKMRKQLQGMDERKARKRANGGRRKGGVNGTSVGRDTSGVLNGLPQAIPPSNMRSPGDVGSPGVPMTNFTQAMDFPPLDALPPPDIGGFEASYGHPPPHTSDHFPPMDALPIPDNLDGYQGSPHPLFGQENLPPPAVIPEQKDPYTGSMTSQFLNTPFTYQLNPSPEIKEAQEQSQGSMSPTPPPEVSQSAGEPQGLSPPLKQKKKLSPRWFSRSLQKAG